MTPNTPKLEPREEHFLISGPHPHRKLFLRFLPALNADVGKISGKGTVRISGRIEGELYASTVLIDDGAQVEGDIVAEELTDGASF